MDTIRRAPTTHQAQAARSNPLRGAVRRALRLGVGVIAAGLALSAAATAPRTPFPAVFPLASLLPAAGGDGSAGFVLNGVNARDYAGVSVSAAGDVNGDGVDDLVIGAYRADPGGRFDAGASYVVFGTMEGFPAVFPLASLLPANGGDGSAGFVINGIGAGDVSGTAVSAAGDVNGDGIDDLVIGARSASPDRLSAGQSYVVFGRNTAQAGNFPAVFALASLLPGGGGDGSAGFVINGIDAVDISNRWGSVSAAGDVNGDGIDDVIIGAPYGSPGGQPNAGQSYVVFGRNTAQAGSFPAVFPLASLLPAAGGDGSTGFVINGIDAEDSSGFSVSAAGDVNDDGIPDLLVGARFADPGGRSMAGESYVVFGRNTAQAGSFPAVFPLASLLPAAGGDGSTGFVINGIDAGDGSGFSVSAAGDLNGDGVDDVLIGAYFADPGGRSMAGESYVVFGRNTAEAGNFPAVFGLASLLPGAGGDGSAGFVINGIDGESGRAVRSVGDVTGDGIGDLIIGAWVASPGGRSGAGQSYVVFGSDTARAGNFPAVFALASLLPGAGGDGSAGFVLNGIDTGDRSGVWVSAAGDVNGDGRDDLIIGAFDADHDAQTNVGESYVVFGRAAAP